MKDPYYEDYLNRKLDYSKSSPVYDYVKEQNAKHDINKQKDLKTVVEFVPGVQRDNKEWEDYKKKLKDLKLTR